MKKFKEAIVAGEKAERMDPGDWETHQTLCYSYGMNNQQELSAKEARLVLEVRPEDLVAHVNLGEALVKLGKKAEARAEWQYALQHNPPAPIAKEAQDQLAKYPQFVARDLR